ncbi:hypothetical protein GR7B_00220 [Vibrio phage vB_VcorM_GR7B]|nr:hypothetical protein GR7B_00220 [Vibrio phage vB_VcorM_GR7B]
MDVLANTSENRIKIMNGFEAKDLRPMGMAEFNAWVDGNETAARVAKLRAEYESDETTKEIPDLSFEEA